MPERVLTLAFGAALWLVCGASCSGDGGDGAPDGGKSSGGTSGSSAGGAGGEGTSPALCPALDPCGGDPDGKWSARAACITDLEPIAEPGCEGALTRTASIEGAYTFFGETNKLLTDIVLTQTVVLDVDDRCARSIANGAANAAIACPLLEEQYANSPQYDSASCELVAADVCHCELVAPPQAQQILNMYTVEGTQLLDAQGVAVDFCVNDDELGIYFVDEQVKRGLTLRFEREK
jgi:hypothetical protein